MAKQVTLTEIGKRAGVSNVAVGAALGLLSETTSVRLGKAKAEMIREVAKEMGYQPNLLARAFRKQETKMIGVLFRVASNPLSVGYMIDCTHRELLAQSYHAYLSPYQSKFDLMWTNVLELLAWRVDGLVLMNVFQTDDKQGRWKELESILADAGTPIVLVASDIQTVKPQPRVNADLNKAMYDAAKHLLDLGHRHLGYVGYRHKLSPERWAGVSRAVAEVPGARIENVFLEPPGGGQLIQELVLAAKATGHVLANNSDRPTGLVCNNDIIAVGIIEGLRSKGLRVPKDVSLTGYDDSDYAVLVEPQLTTFAPPIEDMAKAAVNLLLTHIKDPDAEPANILFDAKMVIRDSTGPAPATAASSKTVKTASKPKPRSTSAAAPKHPAGRKKAT